MRILKGDVKQVIETIHKHYLSMGEEGGRSFSETLFHPFDLMAAELGGRL
jgi:hypothetical protein